MENTKTKPSNKKVDLKDKRVDLKQEIAIKLTNNFNRYKTNEVSKGVTKFAVISVGELNKTYSLWEYYSKRTINPCKYIRDIDGGPVNAIMVGHDYYPKLPIYLKTDKSYNRSENERWKYLNFGKYSGHHIDDIIIEDVNYAKWLLDQRKGGKSVIEKSVIEKSVIEKSVSGKSVSGKPLYIKASSGKIKMPKSEKDAFMNFLYKTPKVTKNKLLSYIQKLEKDILDRWAISNIEQAEKIATKSNKKFLGTIGELCEFELKLIQMKQFEGYKFYKLIDIGGNVVVKVGNIHSKFIIRKGDNDSKKYLRPGDTVKFKSFVEKHEIDIKYTIGEKVTHLTSDIRRLDETS